MSDGLVTSQTNIKTIRFTGKISWEGRMNGLPEEILSFVFYDSRLSQAAVQKIVDEQLAVYHHLGGMLVERDQGQLIDLRAVVADRVLIPMHWIVYIRPEVIAIPAAPMTDEEGIERLPDGSEAPKN